MHPAFEEFRTCGRLEVEFTSRTFLLNVGRGCALAVLDFTFITVQVHRWKRRVMSYCSGFDSKIIFLFH